MRSIPRSITGGLYLLVRSSCWRTPPLAGPSQSKGIVREVQPHDYDRLSEHELTHWWFMNQSLHGDYARRYETGDLTGIAWTVWPPQETTPMLEPEDVLQPGLPDRVPTDAQLRRAVKKAALKVKKAHLPVNIKNLAYYYDPQKHRNTMGERIADSSG